VVIGEFIDSRGSALGISLLLQLFTYRYTFYSLRSPWQAFDSRIETCGLPVKSLIAQNNDYFNSSRFGLVCEDQVG